MNEPGATQAIQIIPNSQCDECHKHGTMFIDRQMVEQRPGVYELSIVCRNCGRRVHSCYISDRLDQLSEKIASEARPVERMRLVRQHKRRFAELQIEMGQAVPLTVIVGSK